MELWNITGTFQISLTSQTAVDAPGRPPSLLCHPWPGLGAKPLKCLVQFGRMIAARTATQKGEKEQHAAVKLPGTDLNMGKAFSGKLTDLTVVHLFVYDEQQPSHASVARDLEEIHDKKHGVENSWGFRGSVFSNCFRWAWGVQSCSISFPWFCKLILYDSEEANACEVWSKVI